MNYFLYQIIFTAEHLLCTIWGLPDIKLSSVCPLVTKLSLLEKSTYHCWMKLLWQRVDLWSTGETLCYEHINSGQHYSKKYSKLSLWTQIVNPNYINLISSLWNSQPPSKLHRLGTLSQKMGIFLCYLSLDNTFKACIF